MVSPQQADAHWFWKQSINRLESLRKRVVEGRDLEQALEFSRYILWCRIDKLLVDYKSDGELKVDMPFLRWKAEELQRQVLALYGAGKVRENGNQSAMEAILHRLDIIAAHVATLSPPLTDTTVSVGNPAEPVLQVLQGGVT